MIVLSKEKLFERLKDLDRDATLMFQDESRYHVIIVGGSALILVGYTSRATIDIDIIGATKVLYDLFWKYDMNGQVSAHENSFPYNFMDRLNLLWSGKKIDFYTASLEDIVIAKLCASRPTDKEDVEAVADKVNWHLLEKLALDDGELKSSILNDHSYAFFLHNYENYVERFRP